MDDKTNPESELVLFIDTIEEVNSMPMDEWILSHNVTAKYQLDTGAKCNVMSFAALKAACSEPIIQQKGVPLRHILDIALHLWSLPPWHDATEIKTFSLTFL